MVDTADLKSAGAIRAGSSPVVGMRFIYEIYEISFHFIRFVFGWL